MTDQAGTLSIRDLLEADQINLSATLEILNRVDPAAMEAAELGAVAMRSLAPAFGLCCGHDEHQRIVDEWVIRRGLSGDRDATKLLRDEILLAGEDDTAGARQSVIRLEAIIARVYLLLRLGRDYLWGVTDLLRSRVTPSLGYGRLQAESAAILLLFVEEPGAAKSWVSPVAHHDDREFYKKYRIKVRENVTKLGLSDVYECGSAMSVHSRIGGVAPGILQSKAPDGAIGMVYQEVSHPTMMRLWLSRFMRDHLLILRSTRRLLPELSDDVYAGLRIEDFSARLDSLDARLGPEYRRLRQAGEIP